jgi:hypothetical protein
MPNTRKTFYFMYAVWVVMALGFVLIKDDARAMTSLGVSTALAIGFILGRCEK